MLYEVGRVPKLGRGVVCVEKKHLPPVPASLAGRVVKARGQKLERRKQKNWRIAEMGAGKQQEPVFILRFWMTDPPAPKDRQLLSP